MVVPIPAGEDCSSETLLPLSPPSFRKPKFRSTILFNMAPMQLVCRGPMRWAARLSPWGPLLNSTDESCNHSPQLIPTTETCRRSPGDIYPDPFGAYCHDLPPKPAAET